MHKKVKRCQYNRCKREAISGSKYCVCHEKNDYKYIIPKFNEEIEKIMENKEAEAYDFRGFYFPKKFNFEVIYKYLENRKFTKKVNFTNCIFVEKANFILTKFTEGVDFSNSVFEKAGDFYRAQFEKLVNFHRVHFKEMADFTYSKSIGKNLVADFTMACFKGSANFRFAIFNGEISFYMAVFNQKLSLTAIEGNARLDFRITKFPDHTKISRGTNLKNAVFALANTEVVDFDDAKWPENKILIEEEIKKNIDSESIKSEEELESKVITKKVTGEFRTNVEFHPIFLFYSEGGKRRIIKWKDVSSIYRRLKQSHQKYGHYDVAGEFFYREMECKKNALIEKGSLLDSFKSLGYSFLKFSCGYGEKPKIVIMNSILAVFGFAFLYFFSKSISFSGTSIPKDLFQSIYFSVITFTTLGHGDMRPITDVGRSLVMSEAVIGAIFIALFIFVFSRKMMR